MTPTVFRDAIPAWAVKLTRGVVAALVAVPGAGKFLTYERSVAVFTALGLPEPGILVVAVGVVELAAAAALVANRWLLPAVTALVPIMLVAAGTAGPTPQNVAVLLGCAVVAADELTRLNRQGRDAGPRTGC
ncbi:DoxX family membrane protein [Halorientalis pallida]|uniref:DoxX family membrane protein n=1 Tax=Halorientalis pallida TaxID=2479928 RepID=UPI003C704C88